MAPFHRRPYDQTVFHVERPALVLCTFISTETTVATLTLVVAIQRIESGKSLATAVARIGFDIEMQVLVALAIVRPRKAAPTARPVALERALVHVRAHMATEIVLPRKSRAAVREWAHKLCLGHAP